MPGAKLKLIFARGYVESGGGGGGVLPPSQSINFGAKTRLGSGGAVLNYAGTGYLGVSSELNGSGVASTHWRVDDLGKLVPRNGATTAYGTAPPTYNGPYALTIAEYSDPGLTNPTGVTSIVTVPISSAQASLNARPDDTDASEQFGTLTTMAAGAAGALAPNDTIWCRDGEMINAAIWRFGIPNAVSGAWNNPAIPGGITVRSVNVDSSLDVNGNPNLLHGFIFHPTMAAQQRPAPILFKDVQFTTSFTGYMLRYSAGGWGFSVENCRFSLLPGTTPSASLNGLQLFGSPTIQVRAVGNRFDYVGISIVVGSDGVGGQTVDPLITDNLFLTPYGDCIRVGAKGVISGQTLPGVVNPQVLRNTGIGGAPASGFHPDFIQFDGVRDDTTVDAGKTAYNVYVTNGVQYGCQGVFCDDSTGLSRNTNYTNHNNIICTSAGAGIALNRFTDPQITFNTVVQNLLPTSDNTRISILAGEDGDITYNLITDTIGVGSQGGTVVTTPNIQIAKNLTAYRVCWPNWRDTDVNSRADILFVYTPADVAQASGGAKLPDGRFCGALFPATAGNTVGAWNDGSVFDPSNPTWVAAHPPAT